MLEKQSKVEDQLHILAHPHVHVLGSDDNMLAHARHIVITRVSVPTKYRDQNHYCRRLINADTCRQYIFMLVTPSWKRDLIDFAVKLQ